MRVTRFYTTSDGGSSFDEVDIPLSSHSPDAWGNELRLSEAFVSPAVRIFEAPAGASRTGTTRRAASSAS